MRFELFAVASAALAVCAAVAPAAAREKKPELGRCIVKEFGKSAWTVALHVPVDSEHVRQLQEGAEAFDEAASNLEAAHEALGHVEESQGDADKLRGSRLRPFLGQDCYEAQVEWARSWVRAIDTTLPETKDFWPTLADGWDPGATCRAYEKLERGGETIDQWLTEIDDKIAKLQGMNGWLHRLGDAANTVGQALLDGAKRLTEGGGFGGGLIAWYTAEELTAYGGYFGGQDELQQDLGNAEADIQTKLDKIRKVREQLETEQSKLKDSADVLKREHNAVSCDRVMDDMVATKEENDKLEIMERTIAAKEENDRRRIEGQAESDAASQFFGGFLQGFVNGLGMLGGGGGAPSMGGGGGPDPRCAQVRAQIQADRNWLGQVDARQHRSAANAVVQAHDQNVAWYNQHCR
jgi:hypothetical protein